MIQKALGTQPIFIGNLVQEHIKRTFPTGAVLVCSADENGDFFLDVLRIAFGEAAIKDMCAAITSLGVITFDASVTGQEVRDALLAANDPEETGLSIEDMFNEYYTIYQNGEPLH